MLDLSLFRKPAFAGVSIVAFALSAAMFAMFLYLTLYMQDVLGLLAALRPACASCRSPCCRSSSPRSRASSRRRIPIRALLGVGLTLVGIGLLLMHGVELGDSWTDAAGRVPVAGVGHRHGEPGDRLRPRSAWCPPRGPAWPRASTPRSVRSASRPASPRSARCSSRRITSKLAELAPQAPAELRRRGVVRGDPFGCRSRCRASPAGPAHDAANQASSAASTRSC